MSFNSSTVLALLFKVDVVLAVANLRGALRLDQILGIDRVDHVGPGDAPLQQLLRVEVHAHHAILAAIGRGQFRSFNGRQTRAQEVGSQVGQLLLGQTLAGQSDLQNGNIRGALSNQKRRCRARRHAANGRLGRRCHFGDVAVKVRLRLQEHLDHRDAVVGLRLDMIDVLDRVRHVSLHDTGEAVLHVLGRKARIIHNHADHGNIDGRKMSTGVCMMATPLRIKIKTDTTMNVYGRLSATLTIHIDRFAKTVLANWPQLAHWDWTYFSGWLDVLRSNAVIS